MNWPHSRSDLSSISLIQNTTSLPVEMIIELIFIFFWSCMSSCRICVNEIIHLIGVISSWLTEVVSKVTSLFFWLFYCEIYCEVISLSVNIEHSLFWKVILCDVNYTVMFCSSILESPKIMSWPCPDKSWSPRTSCKLFFSFCVSSSMRWGMSLDGILKIGTCKSSSCKWSPLF
jgi:hypothetical protein